MSSPSIIPLNVFISYSHNETDLPLLDALIRHLSPLWQGDAPLIKTWDDSHILPGDDWDDEIRNSLATADIVLLLVSADFNSSKYIWEIEMNEAIKRHVDGTCRVVPIWLRDCDFKGMPYEKLKLEILPKNPGDQKLVAVTSWQNQDTAFTTIVNRLRALIEEIKSTAVPRPAIAQPKLLQYDNTWHQFFSQSALRKNSITLLETVNCDRAQHYNTELRAHFKASAAIPENLAYLFSACPTQKPESLAKRLIYFFRESEFTFFLTEHADSDEVYIPELVFEATEEGTWKNFASTIENRFLPKGIEWEAFIKDPEPVLANHKRVAFTFRVERIRWNDFDVADHIRYILNKFHTLPLACRKFVFFFVCLFPDLHEAADEDCENCLCLLEELEKSQNFTIKHIQKMEPVRIQDVKNWAASLVHTNHVDTLLTKLKNEISIPKRKNYRQHGLVDMDAVESMQYAAYIYLRNQKPV